MFEGGPTGLAGTANAGRQKEEPRMSSRFGAARYMLLLFTGEENTEVVTRLGEVRSPPGVPFWVWHPHGDVT